MSTILGEAFVQTDPCIIGATGGSGTRVVARIMRAGGMFIGSRLLTDTEDAVPFKGYFDRWVNAFMDQSARWAQPAPRLEHLMAEELPELLREHCKDMQNGTSAWGWKAPRSIYLLPFWNRVFPRMRFLHVVRDGRDMAFSANQNQVRQHSCSLLDAGEEAMRLPSRAILLWSRLNLMTAQFGETHLGDRYLRVKFEDLCREPHAVIQLLYDFLGLKGDIQRIGVDEVNPPASLGCWRGKPSDMIAELEATGAQGLAHMGYVTKQ